MACVKADDCTAGCLRADDCSCLQVVITCSVSSWEAVPSAYFSRSAVLAGACFAAASASLVLTMRCRW